MKKVTITERELTQELARLSTAVGSQWRTTEEIADAINMSRSYVNNCIRKMIKSGSVEVSWRVTENVVGVACRKPVYRMR